MKEIVPGPNFVETAAILSSDQDAVYALCKTVPGRTQLVWGEHYTECVCSTRHSTCTHCIPRAEFVQ